MTFTKLDYANCLKYPTVSNNVTIKSALDFLGMENAKENHIAICQQITGYLRCMYDLKIIDAFVFNDCIADLKYIRSVLKGG